MGFNNLGLEHFKKRLARYSGLAPIGANVGANKESEDRTGDYETGIAATATKADYLTLNISSPNTPGLRGLQNKSALEDLLTRCGAAVTKASDATPPPTFLKVAPDLDDEAIADIVNVVKTEGAWLAGLIVSNTTLARPSTLSSPYQHETGGLSGAPLMAASTEVLKAFARTLDGAFDLIGVGGISSGSDAYAKIRAGANAVQLYSALVYHGPALVTEIKRDLVGHLKEDGFNSVCEAVGADL
ncbi:UNVERIFIED_CONTAM: hypothetical protein GTU68_066146 [Idotea baltica]|nr:hypothetical protein [Idotea baltica]